MVPSYSSGSMVAKASVRRVRHAACDPPALFLIVVEIWVETLSRSDRLLSVVVLSSTMMQD
jgi:hypothetical protein